MTLPDVDAWGTPRAVLSAIAQAATQILALSGPSGPRRVVCWDGPADVMSTDELEALHNRVDTFSADDEVPRLLATIEALRGTP